MKYSANTILCLFFIIIGLAIISGVGVFVYQTFHFVRTALSAKGIVSEQTSSRSHLVVRFTTIDGRKIEYLQNGFVISDVGEEVNILYNPQNPQDASFNTFWALWGEHLVFLLMGLAFVLAPLFKLIYPNTKWIVWNF